MNGLLTALVGVLRQTNGADVSSFDEEFLLRAADKRRSAVGEPTADAYLARMRGEPPEAEAFVASLHIGYSEFFRNSLTFAVLEQVVLPRLSDATEKPELRIWSAGCASGEEPYSVAILLDELGAARGRELRYRIFATDRCEAGLSAARLGVYGAAAVRNVRKRHLERCFTRVGDSYAISPRLRAQVDFSTYDLLDASTTCPPVAIYGGFDLVLCCNLLFYYRQDVRRFVVDKLHRGLLPGGFFVTGETERGMVEALGGFLAVVPPAAVFRKAEG
jgi:chemotaxis methyl-accepting protein methylase